MREIKVWFTGSLFCLGCGIGTPTDPLGINRSDLTNPEGFAIGSTTAPFGAIGGTSDENGSCTATLITPRHVLTAAHCACVNDPTPSNPLRSSFNPGGFTTSIPIVHHVMHPGIDGCAIGRSGQINDEDIPNDLAVLTLESDAPTASAIVPLFLDSQQFLDTSRATVVGDGAARFFGTVHPFGGDGRWDEFVLDPKAPAIQHGDSGGPLFMVDNRTGQQAIVGVTSAAGGIPGGQVQSWASTKGSEDFLADAIDFPLLAHFVDYALYAKSFLKINDGVRVQPSPDERRIMTVGGGGSGVQIGVDANVDGNVTARELVNLRDRGRVNGSVTTRGSIALAQGASIGGEQRQRVFVRRPPVRVSEPASEVFQSSDNVLLEPDQSREIDPGLYGDIRVASRATLRLKQGLYFAKSISVEPQGILIIERTLPGFPTAIETLSFLWHGAIDADPALLEVITWSHGTTFLETPFAGTVYAMNGSLVLASSMVFTGAFYANDIEVHQRAIVEHVPSAVNLFADQ